MLEGVEGGRIGAGCRVFVGAIGTNLKVWNADGIGTYAAAAGGRCGFEGIFILYSVILSSTISSR